MRRPRRNSRLAKAAGVWESGDDRGLCATCCVRSSYSYAVLLQMDMDYSAFDYDVENEDFYEVAVPAKGQNKRRVTFKQQISTKVSGALLSN
jgi:hypothetical protein